MPDDTVAETVAVDAIEAVPTFEDIAAHVSQVASATNTLSGRVAAGEAVITDILSFLKHLFPGHAVPAGPVAPNPPVVVPVVTPSLAVPAAATE